MKKSIALTGGIGSGKSTVLNCIKSLGYPTFSCDEIYGEIVRSPEYIERVKAIFPTAVREGKIDKKILSEIIFTDKEKRRLLNGLAHPLIISKLNAQMRECADEYVFAEVPLLFEGNYEKDFDVVIVVERDEEERIASIIHRDNFSVEEIKRRMAAQFDYNSKEGRKRLKNCNAIFLKNDGNIEDIKNQIKKILQSI